MAWTDLHIAPAAQRDCTQIVLVCAYELACTEGADGREERRVGVRYLAVGGASQQSRYGLLDGRLFCIFIHRHPWANARFCRDEARDRVC